MGISQGAENSPAADLDNDRIEKLEDKRNDLIRQKEEWIKKFGRDNIPEGLATSENEDNIEIKGTQISDEKESELTIDEKREQIKKEGGLLESWKRRAVDSFENWMRNSWRTRDAVNLDIAVEIMKTRVPIAMEKKMEDFVEGKSDELPSSVWMQCKHSSLFDRILGRPNMIKNLEIKFGNETIKLADENDMGEANKKQKQEQEDKDKIEN